ncbi:MAG: uL13 family ribosomal protein [Candidatus Paceibacterota bacterium]|jgi:large subunit ribosomal protein L13
MEKKIYTIDAAGGKLGRIASKAVVLLIGKNSTTYARNVVFNVEVKITNADKLDIAENKLNTVYTRYSGYPGGLHEKSMSQIIEKHGKAGILKLAISGMIPHNKLKSKIIKNLIITE